ncbi:6291_t:CDS:2, partial [Gigaspora rosea]
KCWNKESIAYSASLIITRNRTVIMKEMEILFSLEFPLEDTEDNGKIIVILKNNETTLEIVDTTQDQSTTINGIINDLTEEKVNSPFRAIPLLTFSWKDK